MTRSFVSALLLVASVACVQAAAPKRADPLEAAARVVLATNAFRVEQGLAKVQADAKLTRTAQEFARFMARSGQFAHDADGATPADRARRHGYDYCMVAENIGYLFRTRGFSSDELAQGLMEGWIRSPGHRKNLVDPDATEIGVGIARAENDRYYGVQLFARPASLNITFSVANESRNAIEYRVGAKRYTLGPRTERQHGDCVPAPVLLPGRTAHPAHGERLVVR
jgi:uncharacterized protein YkwD